jgi:GTPase SAR1 family protein
MAQKKLFRRLFPPESMIKPLTPMPTSIAALIDLFLRSSNVGKTSIITRPVTHVFDRAISSAIGVGLFTLRVETSSGMASLQIWDTARQERDRTLAPMYDRSAQVTILVYAADGPRSLTDLEASVEAMRPQVDRILRP